MPIFTRIMSSYDIGIFSNIISWFNILAIIATFEIYSSVAIARFDYKKDLDSYISSSLVLGSVITLGFYLLALIFHTYVEQLLMINFTTLNIIFIYLLVYPAIQMYQMKNQIQYKYRPIIITSLLSALLSTFLSILLVVLSADKLMGRVIGYFAPLIAMSAVIYVVLLANGRSISRKYWRYALAISFPLIWHLLAGYLLSSADKIMITKMISPEANASYSVAYTISSIASILWASMNNAWSPWAYKRMDEKDYTSLKKSSKPYTFFFVAIVFLLLLITPELLLIMGGEKYVQAKYVMPPVMIGYVFQFIYSLYVNIEFYHKKQRNIAIGTIIVAFLNIGLNFIFIGLFGYIAAAYTTLIGYLCLLAIHFYLVKRLKCTGWYDTKFFLKISLAALAYIPVCSLLYSNNMMRYTFIAALAAILSLILIVNRKKIGGLTKSVPLFKKVLSLMKKEDN